jgi:hypothetical protein
VLFILFVSFIAIVFRSFIVNIHIQFNISQVGPFS